MKNHSLCSHRTSMSLRLLVSLFTAVVMLLMVTTAGAGVTLTATKTDALAVDVNGDGLAGPGDTLEYTVVITNNTSAAVNNVVFADTLDANTSFVSGSLVASPVAINDTYPQIVIGNVSINSSLIPYSVTSNDFLGLNPTATISAFDATSANGGQVTMTTSGANMGQFTYNPPPGFEGTDTFTYTLTNSSGSNTATVTISVSRMVWFINNAASSCTTLAAGCGRLSNPFSTLDAFNALNDGSGGKPAANDNIFVYESATQYTGAVTLLSGQKLIGQDATASLETIAGLTPPSSSAAFPAMQSGNGTVTDLGSTVTLNTNVTVRGLQINSTSSTAMNDPAGTITGVSVSDVSVSSTTATAVALSDVDGTFAFRSISSNGGTTDGISITNQTGSFTVDGDGSNTAVGGNGTGGTIQNKSGADGSTSSGIGIYLNNVNNITLRRMTINGTNQNYGIRGFAVNNFTLEYSTVGGANGTTASLAAPENAGEGSIYFGNYSTTGLTGSATVNKVSVSGGRARNFSVLNTSGTLNRLAITGSNFGLNQNYIDANQSLAVEARNSGTVANVTVRGSTFTGSPGDLVNFTNQIGSTMDVVFGGSGVGENNTLSNSHTKNTIGGGGMTLATGGTMTLNVTNNTFRDANGSAIILQLAAPLAGDASATSLNGTLTGNTIGVSGVAGSGSKTGNGIFLSFADNATPPKGQVTLAITNNTIHQYLGNAAIYGDNTGGNYNADLAITGNTTDQPGIGALYGLALTAGAPSSSDDIDVCASITGNNFSAGDPSNNNDVIVGVSTAASTMRLPGYTGNSLAHVEKFIRENNSIPTAPAVTAYVNAPATKDNFIGGAACSTPSAYLLPSGNRRMVAQANTDGSGLDRTPRQNEKENAGLNFPLDVSKWLKQTASVNKVARSASPSGDHQLSSTPASHRLALPNLSALVEPLGQLFAIPSASAAPAEIPNSAPDVAVNAGTLPGNKSVTIKFRATIRVDLPYNVTQVSNQGTATFDGGSELTDDPATPALNDATITEIPQPDLIVTKTNDVSGTIPQGGTWKWKLTVQNSSGVAPSFAAGQTILVDSLPGTNIGYNPPAVSNFNGPGTINCAIASNILTCTAGTDVTIPANTGKFDVEFTAIPSAAGTFTNPTGGTCQVDPNGNVVESDETNNACNSNSVRVIAPPIISKMFGASHIALNGTTALIVTLTNPTVNSVALTGVAVTDTLPSGLQVASTPNASNTCGISFAPSAGATTLNAAGITLGAGSSCTLNVDVTGTTPGPKTNTTVPATSTNGGTGNSASATLQVAMPPEIGKAFAAASKAVNETTALTFAITNTDSVVSLTGIGFTDNLPSGLQVASTPNPANTCGGSFTTIAGSSSVALTNASLTPSANCSLSVNLIATSAGVKNNTTSSVTSNEGGSGNAASASITLAQGASTISLVKTPVTTTYGGTVYLTATVAAVLAGPAAPSAGTVQFYDNGTPLGAPVSLSGTRADLSVSTLGGGTHNITGTYSGDANFEGSTSPSITHLVNQASTTTTLTRSSPTTVFGQSLTFTANVNSTQGTPTGTVTFYDGVTSLGTASLNGSGIAALTTSTLSVSGSPHTITASYGGDTNFSTSTSVGIPQTVNKASTTAALNASSTNPTYGRSVYLTATLSITAPGAGTPTGTITFYDGATPLYTGTLSSNVVTFVTNTLTVNGGVAHILTAKYNGDSNFSASPSSPAVNATVNRATLNVSADNKTKVYGAPLPALTATYSGFVLSQDATVLTGSPTLTTVPAASPVGSYPITATVGSLAAANYTFNLVNGTLTISAAQLTVSANNQSKLYGASNPTLTYGITGFVNGDTQSTALTGSPGLSTSGTASSIVGTYPISVTQATLRNINPSALNYTFTLVNGTLTVNKDNTSARLIGAAPNPSTYGQAVAFTATVTSTQGITVSGSVTFKDGAATLGSGILNASGIVTFTTSALTASGSPHSITAAFAGSSNFSASAASPAVKQTVNKATTATTLYAPTPNPSVASQAITVSFSVAVNPPGAGMPTGTVTVTDGTASCTAPAGSTSCRITFNTAGTKMLTATYSGDDNFASSASGTITHTVTLSTCSVPAASARTPFKVQNPAYRILLPLILGNAVSAPDLIVQSILPVTTTLQVVLSNQGNEPVKDDFWVDLYINPNPIPTQVNQTWPFLASQGAVWGVVASSAAVPAGGTLKLNVGGPYYWSQLSTMPASLPAGTCVYVQVDSANASTNYGAVLEDHEMQNGAYDNITGIRLDSPITISAPRSVFSPRVTGTPLPPRPTQ